MSVSLRDLKEKEEAVILSLEAGSKEVAKLIALGVLPGLKVRMVQRVPSFVFQIDETQFAVDGAVAGAITVERVVVLER